MLYNMFHHINELIYRIQFFSHFFNTFFIYFTTYFTFFYIIILSFLHKAFYKRLYEYPFTKYEKRYIYENFFINEKDG